MYVYSHVFLDTYLFCITYLYEYMKYIHLYTYIKTWHIHTYTEIYLYITYLYNWERKVEVCVCVCYIYMMHCVYICACMRNRLRDNTAMIQTGFNILKVITSTWGCSSVVGHTQHEVLGFNSWHLHFLRSSVPC